MNLKDRLDKLETKQPNQAIFVIYQQSIGLSDEQQLIINEAEATGTPVNVLCITRTEDKFI